MKLKKIIYLQKNKNRQKGYQYSILDEICKPFGIRRKAYKEVTIHFGDCQEHMMKKIVYL